MKCPHCQSVRLRRSRRRTEDGLWRSMFHVAYRCRDCNRRELHLAAWWPIGAAFVATALTLTFVIGLAVGNRNDEPPASAASAARTALGGPASASESPTGSPWTDGDEALAEAAVAGDARAQLRLGLAYMRGNRVERNATTALAWIEKAANQDNAEAQYVLGDLYLTGRGALQSFPLALEWFQKSAKKNNVDAQYSLGQMYRLGQGVAVDKPQAYFWFNLAAAQGHEGARSARDGLLPSLTAEQVITVQKAGLEWRPELAHQ